MSGFNSSLSPCGEGVKPEAEQALAVRLAGSAPGPGPLLVGVSGGGDSVALLRLLHTLAPARGWRLVAAHVDHGLRPDSADDAEFVARLADSLGVEFAVREVRVEPSGASPEEAARKYRRQALLEMAAETKARTIALGHTAEDQAETLIYRILTGTGPTGLAGMRPNAGPFWRPLLNLGRQELRDYLRELGQDWRRDPTNQDLTPLRNRIRHMVLPLAREMINPRTVEALCRLAEICAREEDYWQERSRRWLRRWAWQEGPSLCLALEPLARLEPVPRARLLRAALESFTGSGQHLDRDALERLHQFLEAPAGRRLELPGGLTAWREDGLLRLDRRREPEAFCLRLEGPGCLELPGLGLLLVVEPSPAPAKPGAAGPVVWLPAEAVRWPLTVRPPRRGERFHPLGAPGSKRLSRFLIDQKVPPWRRRRTVMVCDQEGILWAAPWRLDQRARRKSTQNRGLRLCLVDTSPLRPYTQQLR